MADDNNFSGSPFSGSSQNLNQNKPPLPTGENESPLSTPSDIKFDLRTMSSDVSSIKGSGGGEPRPYVPPPQVRPREEFKPQAPAGTPFAPQNFNPASTSTSPIQPKTMEPMKMPALGKPVKKSSGGLFYVLLVLLIVLGVAALGYFVVYPKFFAKNTPAPEVTPPATTPEVTTPPPAENTPPPAENTPPPATTAPQPHASLFKIAADKNVSLNVGSAATSRLFKDGVQNEVASTPELRELTAQKGGGAFLETTELFSALFPSLQGTSNLFQDDPTLFVYVNQSGSAPGVALKAKSGVNLGDLKTAVAQIESSPDIANIFLSNPPTTSGTWKSGTAGGVPTRYVVLGTGFAFNYGWVQDVLVVSASYDGFKEAARRLQ